MCRRCQNFFFILILWLSCLSFVGCRGNAEINGHERALRADDGESTYSVRVNYLRTAPIPVQVSVCGRVFLHNATEVDCGADMRWSGVLIDPKDPPPMSDISAVVGLTKLRHLDLGGMRVSDVSALAGLTDLRQLELQHTHVNDVSALAGLTDLQELNLTVTPVRDVSPLVGLTNLRLLYLENTQVSDVSALAGLTKLEALDLDHTHVSDVSALAELTKLEVLNLIFTKVSDVSALVGLTNLRLLNLYGTKVPAEQVEELQKALPQLKIIEDP